MTACIVGWAHSKFGKLDGETSESLITKVASEAIAHAGIEPRDVDVIYVGNMNGGFVKQEFHSSLPLQTHPDLRFKPSTRVENACATGSAAIHMGLNSLAAKKARFVLVVGVEKMTELNSAQAGDVLIKASYVAEEANIEAGFAGIFGKITSAYFQRYGDKSDALARIAVKAHRNGVKNPFAHFQKEFDYAFCRNPSDKNPFVAGPLKRTDCSPVTDGAAAVILADTDAALGMKQAIAFRAAEHVNDFLPMSKRDIIQFDGPTLAWKRALESARLDLLDLSFVETHDCFTSAELIEYEAMGLTPRGQGERAILEGWVERDGKLPINVSGGLKAKGHPVGATGVSMHVMSCLQLSGTAGGMQLQAPKLAGIFNMGGAAVANYVSILEPVK
ncbi:thiolase domain-containing protein [Vineibacter terrae]|uniref:Thiolase domain-containing protein n=1 Tax=Vineibacter terrae TaxID=2586908 RepID=A0A5C8PJ73_9HYPH|nr:acetyl-CoA acetyltransferase [Vineibacter terrae]TXL73863.1 thiolase domain-containing protein [Vineibacter terrae]